jgi:hypothetical protein
MRKASVKEAKPGWFASFLGAVVLVAGGFALGLVAGVVSEEPELVVGHLVGRSEEAVWLPDGELGPAPAGLEEIRLGVQDASEVIEPAEVARQAQHETVLPAVASGPSATSGRRNVRDIDSIPIQHASPAIRSGFSVQVGAFGDGVAAEKMSQKLRSKGFDTYVTSGKESKDGKWRVRVGPVSEKAEAAELASRLKTEQRLPTWVVAEEGG